MINENIITDVNRWQLTKTFGWRSQRHYGRRGNWGDELIQGKQDALRLCLDDQQQAGIDIVSDGEQTRQHFVTTFIEHLNGVDFENRKTVRIRNRYDASVPGVVGEVSRQKPVFVDDAKYLRQLTQRQSNGRCRAR